LRGLDPRIPAADYEAGQSDGQRLTRILGGIYAASPKRDVLKAWDHLPEASDRGYRNRRLDEIEAAGGADVMDRLTDEYHEIEDSDVSIYAVVTRYIEARPEVFFSD
jgi:hypothetical protein